MTLAKEMKNSYFRRVPIFGALVAGLAAWLFYRKRPKIVLVGFLARCAKMADGGVYAASCSTSASSAVFR